MYTLVVPIQSKLPELLDASRDDTAWVVTATLLTAAVVTPIAGRLGDMYGKRRIVIALLASIRICTKSRAVARLSFERMAVTRVFGPFWRRTPRLEQNRENNPMHSRIEPGSPHLSCRRRKADM